jgi:hypothetical protein
MKRGFFSLLLTLIISYGLLAQCFPDRHNTSWSDGWISCEKSNNPNAARGKSHWIMYDLSYSYQLGKMHFWNSNSRDYLSDGIRNAAIDISMDGINWMEVGRFEIPRATGSGIYEGVEGPDLGGAEARFVLITALSNWGGYCYGLGEVKIEVLKVTSLPQVESYANQCLQTQLYPNPANTTSRLNVFSVCNKETVYYDIQDLSGRTILRGSKTPVEDFTSIDLDLSSLVQGSYMVIIRQNGITTKEKLIRI